MAVYLVWRNTQIIFLGCCNSRCALSPIRKCSFRQLVGEQRERRKYGKNLEYIYLLKTLALSHTHIHCQPHRTYLALQTNNNRHVVKKNRKSSPHVPCVFFASIVSSSATTPHRRRFVWSLYLCATRVYMYMQDDARWLLIFKESAKKYYVTIAVPKRNEQKIERREEYNK